MKEKSILLTAALLAGVVLTGCSKEDKEDQEEIENKPMFTIDKNKVNLLVGDDYKITPSGLFSAKSSDDDVVTVNSEGVIHGVSAGNTNVVFTSTENGETQICDVGVDWRYHFFDDPVIAFGATREEIKSLETHEIIKEVNPYIIYKYPFGETTISVSYRFDDNGEIYEIFCGIRGIEGEIKSSWEDDILTQLTERYGDYSENGWRKFFFSKKGNVRISFYFPNFYYSSWENTMLQ